jgi:ABC-type glycerol-3-phosphate transport system substrate-binding protein
MEGTRSQWTRRRYLAAVGATGGAAALAACGTGSDQATAKSAGPVTVNFMHNDSNTAARPEGLTRVSLLEEFSKTNSQKITVNTADAQQHRVVAAGGRGGAKAGLDVGRLQDDGAEVR